MAPVFRPPATQELPRVLPGSEPDRFWGKVVAPKRGSAVLRIDGQYQTIDYPTPDQVASATEVYMGGYVHEIDTDTAAALTAAGYTVTEE